MIKEVIVIAQKVRKKSERSRSGQKNSHKLVSKTETKKWQFAPLRASFMVIAILGMLVTFYIVFPQSKNYGVAFLLIFMAMFIASLISMTKAPVVDELK